MPAMVRGRGSGVVRARTKRMGSSVRWTAQSAPHPGETIHPGPLSAFTGRFVATGFSRSRPDPVRPKPDLARWRGRLPERRDEGVYPLAEKRASVAGGSGSGGVCFGHAQGETWAAPLAWLPLVGLQASRPSSFLPHFGDPRSRSGSRGQAPHEGRAASSLHGGHSVGNRVGARRRIRAPLRGFPLGQGPFRPAEPTRSYPGDRRLVRARRLCVRGLSEIERCAHLSRRDRVPSALGAPPPGGRSRGRGSLFLALGQERLLRSVLGAQRLKARSSPRARPSTSERSVAVRAA